MKKMKYLRTWLVVALVVTIIGSLTGGTVAWFTDNVEVANNVIQSGTLDIDIELQDGDKWISLEKEPETKIFDYNLWEPGYTQVETMKIVNRGNLALEYILNVQAPTAEVFTVDGENKTLANAIDVYMSFGEFEPTADNAADTRAAFKAAKEAADGVSGNWWFAGNLAELMVKEEGFTQGKMLPSGKTEASDGVLESGLMQGECTCTIALHMQEEAGNEYQNRSLGNVGFILKAKQFMYEEDSFDEKYDEGAEYGEGSVVNNQPNALVRELTGNELNITCTDQVSGFNVQDFITFTVLTGDKVLDFGLEFSTKDTIADLEGKDYTDWAVDFELSSTKALPQETTSHIALAGHYGFMDLAETGNWIGFEIADVAVAANDPQRIVGLYDPNLTYAEVASIGTFKCGVIVDKEFFENETLTLSLCMYEPTENGEPIKHVLKTFQKTF